MKTLTLKKSFFFGNPAQGMTSLPAFLASLQLHGKESRARTRFIRMVQEWSEEADKTRLELLKKHAERKDGKVVYLDKEGKEITDELLSVRVKLPKENVPAFENDLEEYLNEDIHIDITPATQDTVYGVRDVILKTEESFSDQMATMYDEWCTAFENIAELKVENKAEGEGN